MKSRIVFLLIVALALAACGCDRAPLAPAAPVGSSSVLRAGRATAVTSPAGVTEVTGSVGPGAQFALWKPSDWNGDLILYAHGYTPPAAPVSVPDLDPLRDLLLAQGFAVAASSYSENGYALAEGARQTHQLRGVFAGQFAEPERTFIVGVSLGGIVGLKLAEKFPGVYDGALLVSGVVGGTKAEVQYIGDVRVLFDCLYQNALPGGVTDVPDGPFPQNAVVGAILGNAGNLPPLLCMVPWLPFASDQEAVQSVVTALGFQWVGGEDLLDRAHGHQLYDNDERTYACPLLPELVIAGINAKVARYSSTPDAEAFLSVNYEPSGSIRIPLLTLHNTRDPVVPIGHEALYRAKVEQAGGLGWLLQRSKPTYGHVDFTPQELAAAFADLVTWVNSGTKPPA